jgi:hypothetical protein
MTRACSVAVVPVRSRKSGTAGPKPASTKPRPKKPIQYNPVNCTSVLPIQFTSAANLPGILEAILCNYGLVKMNLLGRSWEEHQLATHFLHMNG